MSVFFLSLCFVRFNFYLFRHHVPREPKFDSLFPLLPLEGLVVATALRLERVEERHLLLLRVGRLFAAEAADEGVLVVPLVQLDPPVRLAPEARRGKRR